MEGLGLSVKVVFATPSLCGPTAPYIDALEKSIPLIKAIGWDEAYVQEVGCPYISHARATMTRKALDVGADVIIYLDYDLSWAPKDLLTLLQTEGDVVAGTYRYKKDEEEYMGGWRCNLGGVPSLDSNKNFKATRVPAGFLKVTRKAIRKIMRDHPELVYGDIEKPSVDLFQHGAHEGVWYGEDMAFSRRWIDAGGEIALVPDLNITHHSKDRAYPGNLHQFMMLQEGGKNHVHSA